MSRDWLKESVFNRFPIKAIMAFCVLVILSNFWEIQLMLKATNKSDSVGWVGFMVGIIFIVFSFGKDLKEEKIGFILFGLSFILRGIVPLTNQLVIPMVMTNLSLESIGTFNFWIAYRKFKKQDTLAIPKAKWIIWITGLLILLIIPAIILWVVGLISSK